MSHEDDAVGQDSRVARHSTPVCLACVYVERLRVGVAGIGGVGKLKVEAKHMQQRRGQTSVCRMQSAPVCWAFGQSV